MHYCECDSVCNDDFYVGGQGDNYDEEGEGGSQRNNGRGDGEEKRRAHGRRKLPEKSSLIILLRSIINSLTIFQSSHLRVTMFIYDEQCSV